MAEAKKLHHKALDHSDDIGAVIGAIVGILAIFHIPSKLGVSQDQLAMAVGFGFTIIAFIRGRFEKSYRVWLQRSTPVRSASAESPKDEEEKSSEEESSEAEHSEEEDSGAKDEGKVDTKPEENGDGPKLAPPPDVGG